MSKTVYPDYDFVNNGKVMHFGTFVRKEHNGEKYLIPVVRHSEIDPENPITEAEQNEFIAESERFCVRVIEKYIIDLESMKIGTHLMYVKEDETEEEHTK